MKDNAKNYDKITFRFYFYRLKFSVIIAGSEIRESVRLLLTSVVEYYYCSLLSIVRRRFYFPCHQISGGDD